MVVTDVEGEGMPSRHEDYNRLVRDVPRWYAQSSAGRPVERREFGFYALDLGTPWPTGSILADE